ncbi:MAG TPA: PBECR2 nuclease fold domain-containing protein [Candidatus Kapabacteria bacterium]|nr:PBECR2 nuclease fold domain-containing protein [Candidatus Kapabacteria bacterium]
MTITAISKNAKSIRLTDERWAHITEEHSELAGFRTEVLETIENPERILLGRDGEMLAVREIEMGKYIVVVFRELESDGFIITAFFTRRRASLDRRIQLWPQ